jgi:hypothetical protein
METLRSLIQIITQKRVKKIELFDEENRNKDSHYYTLFQGIHQRKFKNDQDAASQIYNCDASEKKYLILKTRLKQKLINTIFFLDISLNDGITERDLVKHECERMLFQAKTLLLCGSDEVAVGLVDKITKKAESFGVTEVNLEISKILFDYYAKKGLKQDFLMYNELIQKYAKELQLEQDAHRQWKMLEFEFKKESMTNESLLAEIDKNLSWWNDKKEYLNHNIMLKKYYESVLILKSRLEHNYVNTEKYSSEYLSFMQNNHNFFSQTEENNIVLVRLNNFLLAKNYQAVENLAQKNIGENLFFWIYNQEYRIIAYLHNQEYKKAYQLFYKTLDENNFRKVREDRFDLWNVFVALLQYLHRQDKIEGSRPIPPINKLNFRQVNFLKNIPTYNKQKRGLYINWITIQILSHLDKLDFVQFGNCLKELNQYCRRYPKKDGSFRSECFINMLNILQKTDYRYYATQKATQELYQMMQATPIEYRNSFRNIEIVPYEVYWRWIIEKIKVYKYA